MRSEADVPVDRVDLQEWCAPTVRRARTGITDLRAGESMHSLDLLRLLISRDLKLRYEQTIIGPAWIILQALLPAVLMTFVFSRITQFKTDGVPYRVLVTSALVPWTMVSRAIPRAGAALVGERGLLGKVYFPRLLIPLGAVLATLVEMSVALAVAGLTIIGSGLHPGARLLAIPLLTLWALALALGGSLIVAATSIRHRDLLNTVPLLLQVWLYASPIAYPMSAVSGQLRGLETWNPIAALVESWRWVFVGHSELPSSVVAWHAAFAVAVCIVAVVVFDGAERAVADVL